jgi:hypothetical protein
MRKSDSRRAIEVLKTFVRAKHFISLVLMGAFCFISTLPVVAQSGAQPVSKSFDFRNGALGWQAGFADYAPASDKDGFYQLRAEIKSLPPELGVTGTGFYLQGDNHSDDLFMFLKRRLDGNDGIVAGQTYQVTFTLKFASNAQTMCIGPGSPGESVYLKAGASPGEPQPLLTPLPTDPRDFSDLKMNVDKSNQSQGGIAASVTGDIANGQPCNPSNRPYVSIQRTHQHTSLVNANSQGELWLLVGTDSGFEGPTAIYYQQIDVSLARVNQQPPVLFSYVDRNFQSSGKVAALDSVSMMSEPFPVISPRNLFSSDQRTRINLFAYNLQLRAGENANAITVEAEDAGHQVHVLPIEALNEVPNFNWITQVTVRLPDELQSAGLVSMVIKLRGTPSNKLPVTVQ